MSGTKREQIIDMFYKYGTLRPKDVEAAGISGVYLNKLHREGVVERVSRGLYRLIGSDFDENQSTFEACKLIPEGVVCLLTALRFHELTTQAPFQVWLMIEVKAHRPKIDYPPVRIFRSSGDAFTYGVEEHIMHNTPVKVYSPAKTVADCFKFRNKIGIDVAIEALRDTWNEKKATMNQLYEAAKVCRVANVMRPYLESLV